MLDLKRMAKQIVSSWDDGIEDFSGEEADVYKALQEVHAQALKEGEERGIRKAAEEVGSHWNDSVTQVNQRKQAEASKRVVLSLLPAENKGDK
jgi:hypothetical protein